MPKKKIRNQIMINYYKNEILSYEDPQPYFFPAVGCPDDRIHPIYVESLLPYEKEAINLKQKGEYYV
jgi:hypothetical protein